MAIEIKKCIKIAFEDEESALDRAKQIKKDAKSQKKYRKLKGKKQVKARKMHTYLCRYCCKYHLTSQPQRNKRQE